jgi:putative membrane-bound dehydrogenase-like protein
MCRAQFKKLISLTSAVFLASATAVAADDSKAIGDKSPTVAGQGDRIQVLLLGDRTGHHRPDVFAKVLTPALERLGIDVTFTRNVNDLNHATLAKYDCLAIYGDSGDLPADAEAAMISYVEAGKGLVAIHCASHIFRNSQRYTALVGGRFWKHETGVFRTRIIDAQHPAMHGVKSFESWDETYMHNELTDDRRVLMVRPSEGGYEPWTWVREQGKGRVYYTASGHDERTWNQPGYHALLAAGIRWAAGRANDDAPSLTYETNDVGLPNYLPGTAWGVTGAPITKVQKAESTADELKHFHQPEGFHAELFAAEPDVIKPIAMNFDARGRLWVLESTDYPNNVLSNPQENGNDRIKICEDTQGRGRADKFTIFADKLNIPTGLAFARGGVIVCASPHLVFLKDSSGGDKADFREVLLTGFGRGDTHGTHSNLHYGLDNWMYGSVGYDGGRVRAGGSMHSFRQGYFRFKTDGSDFEPLTTTSNNTWGLGLTESGDVFGSTANGEHSIYMAVANRFYEGVRGWHGNGSMSIEDNRKMHPVTSDVRQVDHFGGYTAAAGHEIYTARSFPSEYWDKAAFVCEPTGHLVHIDWLVPQGAGFVAKDGFNLLASEDAWTAPIAAQVGPDGAVWVLDWYSPVVQHNPTPHGFKTGAGAAYETPLRDKKHGRIWRIVADNTKPAPYPKLDPADPATLIAALGHENLFWRLNAQRLLVERGSTDVLPKLADIVEHDAKGPAALHALRTMQGIGAFAKADGSWAKLVEGALANPSPGVRRAALDCLPRDANSVKNIIAANLLTDKEPLVRKDALLTLAGMPRSEDAALEVKAMFSEPRNYNDRWMETAAICAAAASDNAFLAAAAGSDSPPQFEAHLAKISRIVAEHFARGRLNDEKAAERVAPLLDAMAGGSPAVSEAILSGFVAGWPSANPPKLSSDSIQRLSKLLGRLSSGGRSQVVALGERWKIADKFSTSANDIKKSLLGDVTDAGKSDLARVAAARELVTIGLDDAMVATILDSITPKSSPDFGRDLLDAVSQSQSAGIGAAIVKHWDGLTPTARGAAIAALLSRPQWTTALLEALEKDRILAGDLSLDQQQKLARHADASIATRAARVFSRGGRLPSADRQKVVDEFLAVADRHGDFAKGKTVFEQNCAKCHRHGALGAKIGPDLTGIAVRKKIEILIDVLDPNRSVEGNYQQYNLTTEDGRTFAGLLVADNRTSVELVDAEAKSHVVLREDIESLINTKRSLMPEGFEKIGADGLADLLEFLTTRGKYLPVSIEKVATAVSTRGMFYDPASESERLVFADWEPKTFAEVPFHLVDPRGDKAKNVILLNGPTGYLPPQMPKSVSVPCNAPAKAIHLLSGVSGWGYPYSKDRTVSMIVRLRYSGGATEDIPLTNGEHFADYIHREDVPGSKHAFTLRGGQQVRYIALTPKKKDPIETIEFVKGPDATAPIVVAVTIETGE